MIEVLSDTGLGKETHSVISQGRVEAIVTSKPRDRRLLIEEAAGLGKHRKRRRRAQLKLERTQENLDRALDVEREARTRLRPLKRQAEAAELHERLERQMLRGALGARPRRARASQAWSWRGAEARVSEARAQRERRSRRGCRRWSSAAARPSARWPSAPSATTRSRAVPTTRAPRASAWSCAPSRSAPARRRWSAGSSATAARAARAAGGARGRRRAASWRATPARSAIAALAGRAGRASSAAPASGSSRASSSELSGAGEREQAQVQELQGELLAAQQARARAAELVEQAREGRVWSATWKEVRRVIEGGVERVLAQRNERERLLAAGEVAAEAEHVARGVVEQALKGVRAAERIREEAEATLRELERRLAEAAEASGVRSG